jgi:hypothetical protein
LRYALRLFPPCTKPRIGDLPHNQLPTREPSPRVSFHWLTLAVAQCVTDPSSFDESIPAPELHPVVVPASH